MTEITEKIKSIGALDLTAGEKLIAITMALCKTSDTATLCELTGENKRAVQRARTAYLDLCDKSDSRDKRDTHVATDATDATPVSPLAPASRARIETPYGVTLTEEGKQDPPLVPQAQPEARKVLLQDESLNEARKAHQGVTMTGGVITLHNGTRQFWLDRFGGDDERLTLALIQAAGYVQANSSRPLEAQVGAQLARIAGEKREKDQRYEKAAKSRPAAAKPTSHAESRLERGKSFLAKLAPKTEAVQ